MVKRKGKVPYYTQNKCTHTHATYIRAPMYTYTHPQIRTHTLLILPALYVSYMAHKKSRNITIAEVSFTLN